MNKRDAKIVKAYEESSVYHLHEAYGRFSAEKARAWKYCEELKEKYNGRGLKVLGANTSFFSAGFLFADEDGNECLMYITHGGNRKIVLSDKEES